MLNTYSKRNFSFFLCGLAATVISTFYSCVNEIPEDIPEPGDIPVSLSTAVNNNISHAPENNFQDNDEIGMYIMVQPSQINQTRYIDNIKFTNIENEFTPEETVFFPEGSVLCDFISYYPYQKQAFGKGESGIPVEVRADQTSKEAHAASDFMIATADGVKPSKKAVKLNFDHKLFKLNIFLKPQSGYTPEMLLEANPIVKIRDVYTKATYDFLSDKFTNLNTRADIIPHGEWTIENDMLCGKSAIIIPQTLSEYHLFLELYIGDRLFEVREESSYSLPAGMAHDNTISLLSSDDAVENTITTSINGWNVEKKESEAHESGTTINTSELSFKESNVLKVLNKDKQVAEICLEYIWVNNKGKQAVVAYPMKEGKADVSRGIVTEIMGETDTKINYLYVTSDGEIKTSRPINAIQLQVKPDIFIDQRGQHTYEYALVKIGTQYWMRSNLKAKYYTDGSPIEFSDKEVKSDVPQYYTSKDGNYCFYNTTVIATGEVIPYGWRVPYDTDFKQLQTYLKNNASVLKKGESWINNNHPINNLSGFNASATGLYKDKHTSNRNLASYWCTDDSTPNTVKQAYSLSVDNNTIESKDITSDMALTIRCIRN